VDKIGSEILMNNTGLHDPSTTASADPVAPVGTAGPCAATARFPSQLKPNFSDIEFCKPIVSNSCYVIHTTNRISFKFKPLPMFNQQKVRLSLRGLLRSKFFLLFITFSSSCQELRLFFNINCHMLGSKILYFANVV
jgi:hypothetical protein